MKNPFPAIFALAAMSGSGFTPAAFAGIGDVDPSYGTGGRFMLPAGSSLLLILNDGRLLYDVPGGYSRTDVNGRPDLSFGTNGIHAWPGTSTQWNGSRFIRTREGGFIIGAVTGAGSTRTIGLARLLPDGEPDTRFGIAGVLEVKPPGGSWRLDALKEQPDGKLLAVIIDRAHPTLELWRLRPDGTADVSFGTLGQVSEPNWRGDNETELFLSRNGAIEATVSYDYGDSTSVTLDGAGNPRLDGNTTPDPGLGNWEVLQLLPDGGELIASNREAGLNKYELVVAKVKSDGSVDKSLGSDGTGVIALAHPTGNSLYPLNSSAGYLFALARLPDYDSVVGRLILVGTDSGRADSTFGDKGYVNLGEQWPTDIRGLGNGAALVQLGSSVYRLLGDKSRSPGMVEIFPANSVEEGNPMKIRVARLAGADGAISVDYSTTPTDLVSFNGPDETTSSSAVAAIPGVDFTAASGQLQWADGDTSDRFITIQTLTDIFTETDEVFDVRLSSPKGAVMASYSGITALINRTSVAQPAQPVPVTAAPAAPAAPSGGGGGALDPRALVALFAMLAMCARGRCRPLPG